MLPDYPKVKSKLDKLIIRRFKALQSEKTRPLSDMQAICIHEGDAMSFTRADGTSDVIEPKKIEASFTIPTKDIEGLPGATVAQKLDSAAEQFARQQMKMFVEVFEEATESVGNVVSLRGQPFGWVHLYEMLEKVHVDFNPDGTPQMPTFMVGRQEQVAQIDAVNAQIEADPELKKKFDALIRRKWEEWRAREADRKLVG